MMCIIQEIHRQAYDSQYQNVGSTRNRGVELTINAPILSKKDFSLNFSGNIAYNINRVMNIGGLSSIMAQSRWASSEIDNDYIVQEGQPMGNMYGYLSDGLYTVDDFDYMGGKWVLKEGVADASSIIGSTYFRPGAMKLKDLDGDGKITESDKRVIGNAIPDVTGGFSLSGYYKGFDLSANFSYMLGQQVYNANKIEFNSSRKYTTLRNLTSQDHVVAVHPECCVQRCGC